MIDKQLQWRFCYYACYFRSKKTKLRFEWFLVSYFTALLAKV